MRPRLRQRESRGMDDPSSFVSEQRQLSCRVSHAAQGVAIMAIPSPHRDSHYGYPSVFEVSL
jgi:hypothetical protein